MPRRCPSAADTLDRAGNKSRFANENVNLFTGIILYSYLFSGKTDLRNTQGECLCFGGRRGMCDAEDYRFLL